MTKWVLLLFIWGQDGISAEYTSEKRCVAAASKLLAIDARWYNSEEQKWIKSKDRNFRLGHQRHFYVCTRK